MNAKSADESGPESPPPFERRMVLGAWQAVGVAVLLGVPALALTKVLGDRMAHRTVRQGDWVLNAEVPVCARDGAPLQITVRLARADDQPVPSSPRVEISPGYLARFTEVRLRPSAFGLSEETALTDGSGPVVIELTPDRCGWARGNVGVITNTGERLEMELKTFVFP